MIKAKNLIGQYSLDLCAVLSISYDQAHKLVMNGLCHLDAFHGVETRDLVEIGFAQEEAALIADRADRADRADKLLAVVAPAPIAPPEPPSITKQPVFRPKTNREVYMDDLGRAKLALMDSFQKNGIELLLDDENKFWDSLGLFLEESFGWPYYRNHN